MNPKAQFTELVFLIIIWTRIKLQMLKGGSVAQWLAYLPTNPAALGTVPGIPEIFAGEKTVDTAKVNQQCCLEESGQWLENVD